MSAIAQHAAHAAVEKPYAVTRLVDYQHPQVDEGPVEAAIYVDFGSKTSGTPWNNITATDAAEVALKDAEGRYTQVTLSIDPAFSQTFAGVGDEPEEEIVSGGVSWPRTAWVDSFVVTGTAGAGDSDPATIVISGLTPSQTFDVSVLAARYNGTRTARTTDFQLVGAAQSGGRISQGIRLGSGEGRYPSWEEVPFEEYTLTFEDVAPASDGTLRLTAPALLSDETLALASDADYLHGVLHSTASLTMASLGQTEAHIPHPTHWDGSVSMDPSGLLMSAGQATVFTQV